MIKNFLENQGIDIYGCCVDDEFLRSDNAEGCMSFSALKEKLRSNEYAVVYGICGISRLQRFLLEDSFEKIFILYDDAYQTIWKYNDEDFRLYVDGYERTMTLLADEFSRKTLRDFLMAKKTGDATEDLSNCVPYTYFNDLTKSAIEMAGGYVDCGAFIGDTIENYYSFVGDTDRNVWAFEPDKTSFQRLFKKYGTSDTVHCIPKGVWNEATVLKFCTLDDDQSLISNEGITRIETDTIDSVVGENKVAFIKMDVEGAELNALEGASKTIKRDMPIMAVCAYHRAWDLALLPEFISRFSNNHYYYKLYLRHHVCAAVDLVLYAIPHRKD